MSGERAPKLKGDRAERLVVQLYQAAGFAAERTLKPGAVPGRKASTSDVTVPFLQLDRKVEVKCGAARYGTVYRLDDIGEDGSILTECKSFDPRKNPTGVQSEHRLQLMVQIGLVRCLTQRKPLFAAIWYMNAVWLDDVRVFVVKYDEDEFRTLEQRAERDIRSRLRSGDVRRIEADGIKVAWSAVKGRTGWDNDGIRGAAEAAGVDLTPFVTISEPGDRLTITIRGDGAAKEIRAAKSEQSAS